MKNGLHLNCCINLYAEWGEMYLKYLILTSDDNEIFYNLDIIVNISFGLAQNLLNESDIHGNDLKPLETVMVIYFKDKNSATYSVSGWTMSFD